MILREAAGNAAIAYPVAALSEHLRLGEGFLDDGAEDAILETFLRNAIAIVERRIAQALIRRRFELKTSRWTSNGHLVMPVGPVDTLLAFRLTSPGAMIDLLGSGWVLSQGAGRQVLTAAGGGALPDLLPGYWAELDFEAGHAADWEAVPGDLAQAVMLLASHLYEHRSGGARSENGLPAEIVAILDRHKPVRL